VGDAVQPTRKGVLVVELAQRGRIGATGNRSNNDCCSEYSVFLWLTSSMTLNTGKGNAEISQFRESIADSLRCGNTVRGRLSLVLQTTSIATQRVLHSP
jgi:hypothetical protein